MGRCVVEVVEEEEREEREREKADVLVGDLRLEDVLVEWLW